jgi:hypothetical protein
MTASERAAFYEWKRLTMLETAPGHQGGRCTAASKIFAKMKEEVRRLRQFSGLPQDVGAFLSQSQPEEG